MLSLIHNNKEHTSFLHFYTSSIISGKNVQNDSTFFSANIFIYYTIIYLKMCF